jgi:putative transposase
MPEYRRWHGQDVFLTFTTAGRRPILTEALARELLRLAIERTREERPWEMTAIVLLPDHVHMIWTMPPDDLDYSVRMAVLKKRFTRAYLGAGAREANVPSGQQRHRLRGVWQRRFWEHTIKDARDFKMHLDYIHINPVKHGLVKFPKNWPWSSFHRYVRSGEYENDWCGHVNIPGLRYTWGD